MADIGTQLIELAMKRRIAAGLSVETVIDGQSHVRHCTDAADRDAYIARCAARGETVQIVSAQ